MHCAYHAAGVCGSCTRLALPYPEQVSAKERSVRELLEAVPEAWLPTLTGPEAGFRNKAKMVVGGTVEAPTLGIIDADLRECPLYSPAMQRVIAAVAGFVTTAGLTPYDVPARRGELKHVLLTESPDGEFLLRFVLRSSECVPRIRKHLASLQAGEPAIAVVTVNLLPEHKAALEGEVEEVLTERTTLPIRLGDLVLHLGPRSFFQTNTELARGLYRQAAAWVDEVAPRSMWDLYCGVGGFALSVASAGRRVLGVEVSADAVDAARRSAAEARLTDVRFVAGDATAFARGADVGDQPDLVIVNPPRRGIGPELASWLEGSDVRDVVYSSCNATSLASDLAVMASFRIERARLVDLFPHTDHYEVIALLRR